MWGILMKKDLSESFEKKFLNYLKSKGWLELYQKNPDNPAWKQVRHHFHKKLQEITEKNLVNLSVDFTQKAQDYGKKAQKQQIKIVTEKRLTLFNNAVTRLSGSKSIFPNLIAHAKIFVPTKRGRRKFFRDWQDIKVIGHDNLRIQQRYEQLNQLDLTGWLILIKFLDKKDYTCRFTKYEFLKRMHKQGTQKDYKWLRAFLDRIGGTQFCITVRAEDGEDERFRGSLAPWDAQKGDKFVVQLNEMLYGFFSVDDWSYIDLEQRFLLRNEWAQAFHAYLSTHRSPTFSTRQKLHEFWGENYHSATMFWKDFKRRVLKPLHEIGFITKVHWDKKTDIVRFDYQKRKVLT